MHAIHDLPVTFQYAQEGHAMWDDTYAEHDADSAAVFTEDGHVIVAVIAEPDGWVIDASDYGHVLDADVYDETFSDVAQAADYVAERIGVDLRRVDSWLSEYANDDAPVLVAA